MSEKPFLLPCYSKLHTTALELNTFWNPRISMHLYTYDVQKITAISEKIQFHYVV